jgi:NAD(P)-dependent dehydrogenase (short-subunit alcohol dehydrogenase family)
LAELKGKTAIVTGASEGIGEATVLELASHGVTVIAAARNLEKLNDLVLKVVQSGGSAHAARCDVSNFKDLVNTVKLSLDLSGRLDILINNAGLIDPIVKLADSDPE